MSGDLSSAVARAAAALPAQPTSMIRLTVDMGDSGTGQHLTMQSTETTQADETDDTAIVRCDGLAVASGRLRCTT